MVTAIEVGLEYREVSIRVTTVKGITDHMPS
jgi:hypothetical protein